MHANDAYNAGMQYTLRNIPPHLDRALREKAKREQRSLNEVAVEALLHGLGLEGEQVARRDLGDVVGTWVADREVDAALDDQRAIDADLWR